jgi:hypothetical protein
MPQTQSYGLRCRISGNRHPREKCPGHGRSGVETSVSRRGSRTALNDGNRRCFQPGDRYLHMEAGRRSAERASAALGPPKCGKILSTILQKQIREARCSNRAQDARLLDYRLHRPDGLVRSTKANPQRVTPGVLAQDLGSHNRPLPSNVPRPWPRTRTDSGTNGLSSVHER